MATLPVSVEQATRVRVVAAAQYNWIMLLSAVVGANNETLFEPDLLAAAK